MANGFTKAWKYLMALFSSKVDEYADPKVQIQQAIEDAQRQHQALSQQAAAVIGNQRQLEMKLNRQLGEIEKLQASARQALVLADKAARVGRRGEGGPVRAVRAGVRHAAGHGRAVGGGPQDAARPVDPGRGPGEAGRRAQLDDAAAEDRRAHQAAVAAGAGEDAGAGRRVAAPDERARRAGQHAVAGGGARQDRAALRQRHRLGRARAELRAGPDAGGPGQRGRHGGRQQAGADPGVAARHPGGGRGHGGQHRPHPRAHPADQHAASSPARPDGAVQRAGAGPGWHVGHQ